MPDTTKTIMCIILPESDVIDVTNCTDQNYQRLKRHVNDYYTFNGAVLVPHTKRLDWEVDRKFLEGGAIFTFANQKRQMNHVSFCFKFFIFNFLIFNFLIF